VTREGLIVDCDPGHDDVLAILTAARYGTLVGITTVAGNAALEHTTRNAIVTAELGHIDVPVHAGAPGPLAGPTRDAVHVHGDTGLAGVEIPVAGRTAASDDGPGFIVETARARPGLWIVAVGPLTNVALAMQRAPDLAQQIAGISIMGGGTFGNATAAAEFNIWADPEAADVVFASGARIRCCGLDLTHQVCVDDAFLERLDAAATPVCNVTCALLRHYRSRIFELVDTDLAALHDPCAVLAVTHPHLFEFTNHRVRIELHGTHTRGMTVIDRRVARGPVEVAWRVDAPQALQLIGDAVLQELQSA
jgi:inosine-uridine nucleoside N-ribohydrolase